MELLNTTRFPAHLFRGCFGDADMFGSLAVRITHDIRNGGLVPAEDQPWLIHAGPWDSPYGPLPGDELTFRGGTDLFVFGSCRPPSPAVQHEVSVEAGPSFRASVLVFGRRFWRREGSGFAMTKPELFTEMPLALSNSFGGQDEWDGLTVAYPSNPAGKGYSHTDEHTDGRELPNVEDPARLIQQWDDAPIPVGVCAPPPFFPPRVLGALDIDPETGLLRKVNPRIYNAAFPALVAPGLGPDDLIRVHGVTGGPPLEFRLPSTGPLVRLTFEEMVTEAPCPVDQVGIEVDQRRVFLSYRYPFRYVLVPLQRRQCELLWPDDSQKGQGVPLAEALDELRPRPVASVEAGESV